MLVIIILMVQVQVQVVEMERISYHYRTTLRRLRTTRDTGVHGYMDTHDTDVQFT